MCIIPTELGDLLQQSSGDVLLQYQESRAAKKSSFSSIVPGLGWEAGCLGERFFNHCLTDRDKAFSSYQVERCGLAVTVRTLLWHTLAWVRKDWLFALPLLIVTFLSGYRPSLFFKALWYCRLELQGGCSIPGHIMVLMQEEADCGPGTKCFASLRNSHLTCIWHKCTLQFIELLIMNTVITVQ